MRARPKYVLPITGTLTQGANSIQTLTKSGALTEGHMHITISGEESGPIQYNDTAATAQTVIQAMAAVGSGNMLVTGGPIASAPFVCTTAGTLEGKATPTITITNPTFNDARTATVTETKAGVVGSYRGFPKDDTILIKTDGIGLGYYNSGTTRTPTWTAMDSTEWGTVPG